MTEEEKRRRGAGIVAAIGWVMILTGVSVLWGYPGSLIVVGLWFAVPVRYMKP